MVETELVNDDIAKGFKAIKALDIDGIDVRSALWLHVPDVSEYRFVLALPVVDREGPEAGYRVVQRSFKKHQVELPLRRVSVVETSEPLLRGIHKSVGNVGPNGDFDSQARLGPQVINGFVIDDAWIYRSS